MDARDPKTVRSHAKPWFRTNNAVHEAYKAHATIERLRPLFEKLSRLVRENVRTHPHVV